MPAELLGGHLGGMLVGWLVALAAAAVAFVPGVLLAAWLAMARFSGRGVVVFLLFIGAGLPPVLFSVWLLGLAPAELATDRLASLAALGVVQAVLLVPLVASLALRDLRATWQLHGRTLESAGASRWQALWPLLRASRAGLEASFNLAMARALAEFGVLMLVVAQLDAPIRGLLMALPGAEEAQPGAVGLHLLALAMLQLGILIWVRVRPRRAKGG